MNYFKLDFTFKDRGIFQLLDLSSFLYDIELMHDLTLLTLGDEYKQYKFNRYFWYRNGRPIKNEHKIILSEIQEYSPLKLKIIVGLTFALSGSLWAFVQVCEKIYDMPLNHQKLAIEVQILEREERIKFYEEEMTRIEFENKLVEKDGLYIYNRLGDKLNSNPIRPDQLSIQSLDPEERDKLNSNKINH